MVLRVAPPALIAVVLAARVPGMDPTGSDRVSVPLVGVGVPLVAIVLWLLRWRWPGQETLAGAARVVTLLAVVVVAGLLVGTGSH